MDGKSLITEKPRRVSARAARILKKREPQIVELAKKCLVLKGHKSSQVINDVIHDVSKLLKPNCVVFNRKNEILPFEDANSIEFLAQKNDCSTFLLGSHTKKRPNNLVLGRTFDGHVLDMFEFGLENYHPINEFEGMKKAVGSKPMMAFLGSQWDVDTTYNRIQNILIDTFRGTKFDMLSLQSIDHILVFTVIDGLIYMRGYAVALKKSGTRVPNVKLIQMGPYLDLTLRRNQLASDDMWKTSCKQPKSATVTKVKNISRTSLGDKVGRIHMKRQNLDKLAKEGRKVTALRNTKRNITKVDTSAFGEMEEVSGTVFKSKKPRT